LIPTPKSCSEADSSSIAEIIRPTGFYNVKADRMKKMSKKWVEGFTHPKELPGVGKYALESWDIFVNKKTDFTPSDKKLKMYLESL
jgi:endonuclease III-like uncharacterized protein